MMMALKVGLLAGLIFILPASLVTFEILKAIAAPIPPHAEGHIIGALAFASVLGVWFGYFMGAGGGKET
jgi:hypothetical protein